MHLLHKTVQPLPLHWFPSVYNLHPGVAGVTLASTLGPPTCPPPAPRTHGVQLVRYVVVRTLAVVLTAMTSDLLRPPAIKQGVLAIKLPPSSVLGGGHRPFCWSFPTVACEGSFPLRAHSPPFPPSSVLWPSWRSIRPHRPAGCTPKMWEDTPTMYKYAGGAQLDRIRRKIGSTTLARHQGRWRV